MTAIPAQTITFIEGSDVVEIAPNDIVDPQVMRRGSQTIALIVMLFLGGALLTASIVLGSTLLAIGTFVAFSMMLLIGLPLTLACVEDAIDSQLH